MNHHIDTTLAGRVANVLDQWADGIRRHQPDQVALLFTPDALLQGFDPEPGFGRAAVAAYYAKQPVGLSPEYTFVSVRELGGGIVTYAHVSFDSRSRHGDSGLPHTDHRTGSREGPDQPLPRVANP